MLEYLSLELKLIAHFSEQIILRTLIYEHISMPNGGYCLYITFECFVFQFMICLANCVKCLLGIESVPVYI